MSNPQNSGEPTPPAGGLTPIGGMPMLTPIGGSSTRQPETPPAPSTQASTQAPPVAGASVPGVPGIAPVGGNRPVPPVPPNPPLSPVSPVVSPAASTSPGAVFLDEEPTGPPRALVAGIGGAVVALLGIAFFLLFAPKPPAVIPSEYEEFTSKDNTFRCDTMGGWKVWATGEAAGEESSTRANGVFMESGSARIEITMSRADELVGAQLLFGNEVVPEAMTGSRAASVEKMQRTQGGGLKKRYKNYKETLQPRCPSGMGGVYFEDKELKSDSRLYEFTADGNSMGLGGKRQGYRAYAAGAQLIATIHCECSQAEWPRLKPHFLKIIRSVEETRPRQPGEENGSGSPGTGLPGVPQMPGLPR